MIPQFETYDDGAFTVFSTRWGTYAAKTPDGTGLCSGIDKESVVYWAREHLNGFKTSSVIETKVSFGTGYKL